MLLRSLFAFATAALLASDAAADEPRRPANEPSAEDERRLQIIEQTASAYTVYNAGHEDQPLTRSEMPLLKFEDPVTQATQGAVYVWSDERRRPLAIASIYFRGDGARVDEFQSLAEGELVAKHQEVVVWRPLRPGLEWKDLAGSVPQRDPLRLAKMRDLARQFAASVSDAKAGRQELRLLPQPIYRYDDEDHDIVDGALFCYAKGTNPEILLLLQAVKAESRTEWKFAFCRMTERECEVKFEGRIVWIVGKAPIPQAPDETYFNRTIK